MGNPRNTSVAPITLPTGPEDRDAAPHASGMPLNGSATRSALHEQARAAHRQGNDQAALDVLTQALATDSHNADLHWQRATILVAVGRLADARAVAGSRGLSRGQI
jgi:Flp pilus assembly protein TadD